MSEDQSGAEDLKKELRLKLPEPEIEPQDPWSNDALDRSKVAIALTNLIRDQADSLVVSLNGPWGTGKTFFLKRWQKNLEQEGFHAIYFNAWEDDFCDDPLVAIIGQLSEFLKEKEDFKEYAPKIKEALKPLLARTFQGVTKKFTGVDLSDLQEQFVDNALEEYSLQRKNKVRLKAQLKEMSTIVAEETGHPLVFIIDELDRCRPTFSIELLERVKHIFDVPGMVFVFGVNRDELCSSIKSIYGEIEADVYLRRFFDMEFLLPEASSENFCRHLIKRYKLKEFFFKLSDSDQNSVHNNDFKVFDDFFPLFCNRLDLSLRDIDHCIRSMALVGRHINVRHFMYPHLLSVLITLRLKNHALYQGFVKGDSRGSEVMDYIDGLVFDEELNRDLNYHLDLIEVDLYLTLEEEELVSQLKLFLDEGKPLPEYLSERTRKSGAERQKRLLQLVARKSDERFLRGSSVTRDTIQYLSGLIELVEITQQRQQR